MQGKKALLIVDMQNDFCPGGALPVAQGDEVVAVLNRYIDRFKKSHLPILATRDWHPEQTKHFNTAGGVWPPHCIRGTEGARFHPDLRLPDDVTIISKGMSAEEDSYSGFQGRDATGVPLAELLRRLGIDSLFVGGLATDYCVKFTVIDGLKENFEVFVLLDAVRGVDLQAGDSDRAVAEMMKAGAKTTLERELAV